ncbi:hypothetical protein EXS66_02095 [Candidatus Saccharibacteria bacterium]|nr:hypothetical protein [Candidatus Saccharibacteria bacterium]
MEPIRKDFNSGRHRHFKARAEELAVLKNKITELTGYEPETVRIKNDILYVKGRNQYESLEMRLKLPKELEGYKVKAI